MNAKVAFNGVRFGYDDTPIFRNFNFQVRPSSYLAVVGQSGSGKTTLLRLVAGLESPQEGEIGVHAATPSTSVQLVFQDYFQSLLPWLSVQKNVALGLPDTTSPEDVHRRVEQLLADVGLRGVGRRLPREISGGMQQRVVLARALAASPNVLLLDEPFGSLDTPAKLDLQDQLLNLWQEHALTCIHVTHDLDEACYLSDQVLVLSEKARPRVFENTLPRPRHRLDTRESERFLTLRRALFQELGYA